MENWQTVFKKLETGLLENKLSASILVKENPQESLSRPETHLQLEKILVSLLSSFIGIESNKIDITRPFSDYGLDSKSLIGLSGELSDILGLPHRFAGNLVVDGNLHYPRTSCCTGILLS
jgi:hypothetical protein